MFLGGTRVATVQRWSNRVAVQESARRSDRRRRQKEPRTFRASTVRRREDGADGRASWKYAVEQYLSKVYQTRDREQKSIRFL